MTRYVIIAISVVLIILLALFVMNAYDASTHHVPDPDVARPYVFDTTPVDFSRAGTITVGAPGSQQGQLYLVYEEPGAPALTKRLILDEESVCGSTAGAIPCMAMSATFDAAFHGKRASIDGIQVEDGVRVRKLMTYPDGEMPRVGEAGDVFIPWMQARRLILSCEVVSIMQTHALDVYLTLSDGSLLRTVEPTIDGILRVLDGSSCPRIPVATE